MAQDQSDILEQTHVSDHKLLQSDNFKESEAPSDDYYEYVMIDSILRRASDDLWQDIKD